MPLEGRREEYTRREAGWFLCVWRPLRGWWRWASYDATGLMSCSSIHGDPETAEEAMDLADAWLAARLGEAASTASTSFLFIPSLLPGVIHLEHDPPLTDSESGYFDPPEDTP